MASKSFLVENFTVHQSQRMVFWKGARVNTVGNLTCAGSDHRFIVYFLADKQYAPQSMYIPEFKLGVQFVSKRELDSYLELQEIGAPVYAYLDTDNPEWNALTVNEPVRSCNYVMA
ncbi:hypothetical protein [Spongiivirga citrea]|uniref:Uncharacterized protein n=1 Tax=Spongiivirga citrea TaxID=1481457 RepID=A0A6M0CL97_9FLAO|nr:hypothetical protein [Spongiivirga citrea]NER18706.1 hypothetical protein [Spongiivirga citrea]